MNTNGGLHNLAHHVRGKGRGKDSMLVHMTPREVQGLQALAKAKGGTLTINPETGLPEAGFLEDILPVVAMAAATYFTAGAAAPALATALGPAAAGGAGLLSAGAATTAGGIIGGGLAGAGVGAIGAGMQGGDVGKGALYGGLGGAITGGMGGYDNVYGAAAATPPPVTPNAPVDPNLLQGAFPEGPPPAPGTPGTPGGPPTAEFRQAMVNPPPPTPSNPNIVRPDSMYQQFGEDSIFKKGATLALPGITGAMGGEKPYEVPGEEPYVNQSLLSPNFRGYTPAQPDPYYRAQYTRYAADGGLMGLRSFDDENGIDMASGGSTRKKKRASLTADRTINSLDPYNAAIAQLNNARYGANMSGINALNPNMTSLGELPVIAGAKGGIASLGGYSDGGRMLRGPGDGMSDSIPGVIGNKQPARLADGEFVVPADVVSHLGNGSTDAGARKLYAMMDKVRRARTGKKKQAPAVKTSRYMPA